MNNKTAKQILSSYRLKLAGVVVLYLAALAVLIYVMTFSMLVGIVGVIALGLSVRTPIEKIRTKDLESIIFENLDPEKFNELLELGAFKKSTRLQVLCAVSLGDHENALNIIDSKDTKRAHPVDLCNRLYRKGYIYFERGEFDKLAGIVSEYKALKKKHPQFAPALNSFSVFDKFDAFADEDYEYVVDVCDIDLNELDPKKQNHFMTEINVGFYRAVSLYKLGRLNEAREGFEHIIKIAPKMYKAKLSKDYIELISKT